MILNRFKPLTIRSVPRCIKYGGGGRLCIACEADRKRNAVVLCFTSRDAEDREAQARLLALG